MIPTDPTLDDAARAVLDGTPVDWSDLETSPDLETRGLAEQLKVLSTIAGVHRTEARPDGLGRWGHLQLLEIVGAGAVGEVYRAWDTRLDREVALKLMPARARAGDRSSTVIQEGRLLARVRHPNVATIYGAESLKGRIGLWMEFVRGRTLEELLKSGHQFSLPEVVRIGLDLCQAVSAVHDAGLLHRDIKTQNVMRAEDGRIVLMDFGAGREQREDASIAAGTPLYLAPEIFLGQPATLQSDVYSVGVLLYRLLTGSYPVAGQSIGELRRAHESGERGDLRSARVDLPPTIAEIVARATHSDPAHRYKNCEALAADLRSLIRERRLLRWTLVAALAAGVAVTAWVGWNAYARAAVSPFERPMIAVLPFKNLNTEPDSEFAADALTYELIRNLAIIKGLDVRSATSSFALKNKPMDLAGVGRQLGVNLVLEGSVFRSGDQVRVQAQLAQVAGDTPLWTNKFVRQITDMGSIQDEIARAVVNQLRLTLGQGQRRYDLDVETSALYLKARTLVDRGGTQSGQAAVPLFEQIIARDPAFAPAYAGLADAYAAMSQELPDVLGLPHQRALALMRSAAQKAMELDPLLAESYSAMGFLYSREFDWDAADRSFRRALELNPTLSQVSANYSTTTLLPMGRFAEAESRLLEARRRDPLSLLLQRDLGLLQLTEGHFDDAIRTLEAIRAVDASFPYVPLLLARAQSLAGRLDEAMPYWDSVRTEVGSQHWLAYAYVKAGRRAEVERLVAQHTHPYRLSLIYTALGDTSRALEALDRAADEAPHRTARLLQYPELASLRGDPRFEAVRAKFHLR